MEDKLKEAIKTLAGKVEKSTTADDALKYTQAALNAANALRTLDVRATERSVGQ